MGNQAKLNYECVYGMCVEGTNGGVEWSGVEWNGIQLNVWSWLEQ